MLGTSLKLALCNPAERDQLLAVELLPGVQVDGTWNVPTTLTLVGCVRQDKLKLLRALPVEAVALPVRILISLLSCLTC